MTLQNLTAHSPRFNKRVNFFLPSLSLSLSIYIERERERKEIYICVSLPVLREGLNSLKSTIKTNVVINVINVRIGVILEKKPQNDYCAF